MLVRSPFRNSFWRGNLHFLYPLKMITVISKLLFFFSHTHTHKCTNSTFSSWILFSIASAIFQNFFTNQTHTAMIYFWFLETQGSTINSIYGLLFLSKAPQDSIDTTASKLFMYSSIYIRTAKLSYSKKGIFHLVP